MFLTYYSRYPSRRVAYYIYLLSTILSLLFLVVALRRYDRNTTNAASNTSKT